eukprot:3672522-Rhodomonas_salina.1
MRRVCRRYGATFKGALELLRVSFPTEIVHTPGIMVDIHRAITTRKLARQLMGHLNQSWRGCRIPPQKIATKSCRLRHPLLLPDAKAFLAIVNLLGRLRRISHQIVLGMSNMILC